MTILTEQPYQPSAVTILILQTRKWRQRPSHHSRSCARHLAQGLCSQLLRTLCNQHAQSSILVYLPTVYCRRCGEDKSHCSERYCFASAFLHLSRFGKVSMSAQASLISTAEQALHHVSVPSFSQPDTWAVVDS